MMTWYAPLRFSLPYLRASLTAPSLASAPLLLKNTRSRQLFSTSSCASLTCGTVKNWLEVWISVRACSATASTSAGWQWPSVFTAQPAVKSRYSLSFSSQTREPLPLTSTSGCRRATCM